MEQLFTPHVGLMVWTIVTFLLVVFILGKFGWGPLIKGLSEREAFLREQRKAAEDARIAAEQLKKDYESRLADTQVQIGKMIADAHKDAQTQKQSIVTAAREESEKILEKGRRDLNAETDRLRDQLRNEVAGLSVMIAEKVLRQSVDPKVQEKALAESMKSLSEVKK